MYHYKMGLAIMGDETQEEPPDRRLVRFFIKGAELLERSYPRKKPLLDKDNDKRSLEKIKKELIEKLAEEIVEKSLHDKLDAAREALENLAALEEADRIAIMKALLEKEDIRKAFLEEPLEFMVVIEDYGVENCIGE
ncbi:MAG: hypothetical protein D6769_03825 [Methanobacteriota archaeon]|nr:MAG: hypothetical protein D6769_03825 [Euryarchaeota archaeon]